MNLARRLCEKWEAEEEEARAQDRPSQTPDGAITVITEEEQLNELRRYYREPLSALKEQGARDKRLDASRRLIQRVREKALGGDPFSVELLLVVAEEAIAGIDAVTVKQPEMAKAAARKRFRWPVLLGSLKEEGEAAVAQVKALDVGKQPSAAALSRKYLSEHDLWIHSKKQDAATKKVAELILQLEENRETYRTMACLLVLTECKKPLTPEDERLRSRLEVAMQQDDLRNSYALPALDRSAESQSHWNEVIKAMVNRDWAGKPELDEDLGPIGERRANHSSGIDDHFKNTYSPKRQSSNARAPIWAALRRALKHLSPPARSTP